MNPRFAVLPVLLMLTACGGGDGRYAPESPPVPPVMVPPRDMPAEALDLPPPPPSNAGPLTLAGIGSYMDAQESDLRNRLRGTGAVVTRPGDDLVIVLRTDLLLNGMAVTDSGASLLATIADVLRHYDRSAIQVQGYTDTIGRPERNLTLSETRAKLVLNALIQGGVSGQRISAQGFGETRLRVSTGDNIDEPRNRRIEIRITARPG